MRMAVAMVDGSLTTSPRTIGALPEAWKPHMRGVLELTASAAYSLYPFQYAVMLPALPTGRTWMSGASPSMSTISKAAVFCPSIRTGLTELTSATG
ncbi:hypothetical protein SUDANB135_04879 [Streptomyces sp. SudanB135_2055]